MIVKVGISGGQVSQVDLEDNATVATALEAAGVSVDDRDIKVDGRPATLTTPVNANSYVQLCRKVKGA